MNTSLQQQFCARIEQCYQIAESTLGRHFVRPEISFSMRGQAAGAAHLQHNRLRFNAVLAADNQQAFLSEVIPHEICHLLVWQLYGKDRPRGSIKPHGAEWQQLMVNVYNLSPSVRHQFDVSKVKPKQFEYCCDCQTHQLTIRRHNKIQRGQAEYHCRRCRGSLRPI